MKNFLLPDKKTKRQWQKKRHLRSGFAWRWWPLTRWNALKHFSFGKAGFAFWNEGESQGGDFYFFIECKRPARAIKKSKYDLDAWTNERKWRTPTRATQRRRWHIDTASRLGFRFFWLKVLSQINQALSLYLEKSSKCSGFLVFCKTGFLVYQTGKQTSTLSRNWRASNFAYIKIGGLLVITVRLKQNLSTAGYFGSLERVKI